MAKKRLSITISENLSRLPSAVLFWARALSLAVVFANSAVLSAFADVPAFVEIKDLSALDASGVVCAPPGGADIPVFSAFPNCAPMPVARQAAESSASTSTGAESSGPSASNASASTSVSTSESNALLQGGVSSQVQRKSAHAKDAVAEHRRLDNGPLLLSKDHDVVVDTLVCPVRVSANAVALIVASEKSLVVYNLHDDHKNAIVLDYKNGPITLIPGHAVAIANSSFKTFEDVNPAPYVYYRHLTNKPLDGQRQSFEAEFQIFSLVKGLPPVNALINSEDAEARHRMDSMLKTTAIMMQLTNSSDPFALYMTPAVRALAIKSAK